MFRKRLTSISSPFGGLGWEYVKSEEEIAERLITFLEDRRVIADRMGHAGAIMVADHRPYAIKSVRQIRTRLRQDLEELSRDSKLAEAMRLMQRACRDFLNLAEAEETYSERILDDFRSVFASQILRIATTYHFSIETEGDEDWGPDENTWREYFVKMWGTGHFKLTKDID